MKKILAIISLITSIQFGAISQGPPTRSTGFYCSCSGNGSQPYTTQYNKFVHYQLSPTGKKIIIAQFCNFIEFAPYYKVAADGGVSYIDIEVYCAIYINPFEFLDEPGYDLNEFAEGDFDRNGKLSIESRTQKNLILKYEHPKKIPDGVKSFSVYPSLNFFGAQIEIFYPPVAMIHGLWADRTSFDDMESDLLGSGLYDPWQLYKIDYKSSNDRSFSTNQHVAQVGVDQVLGQCWDNFIAVSKANVVGHSMGGLLTRNFVQGPLYNQFKTVNKIITCNTPHQGSQMANWLLDNSSVGGTAAATALDFLGMSSYNGAVNDLRVGSSAIVGIQSGSPQNPVKVHAINTVQPHSSTYLTNYYGTVFGYVLAQIVNSCGGNYITDIFDSSDSDIVVALESQAGGLSGLQTDLYNNQVHVGSTANPQVIAGVKSSLGSENTSPSFASQFNSQILGYSVGSNCLFNVNNPNNREAKTSVASLSITAPLAGQNVIAGNNLIVTFTSTDVDSVVAYLPQTHQNFAIRKVKFSNNSFTLPTDIKLIGPVKLVLLGYSAAHVLVANANVTINQTTSATLQSIYVYPSTINLHQNDSLAISVYGKYSDNIDRNITESNLLSFSFANGNATKIRNNIVLNNNENDILQISEMTVGGRKSSALFGPITVKINPLDQTFTPLPLNLVSFIGKSNENGNLLEWKTTNETNFSHFEVEKSPLPAGTSASSVTGGTSSQKFEKIGKKVSNESGIYEYLDGTRPSGEGGLYRLKLIDLDGKFTYSKIIYLKNESKTEVSAFPNPFSNQISIENFSNKELRINLLDMTGREIIKPISSTLKRIDLNTEKIETGIYILQIKDGEKIRIQKIIKQ